MNHNRKVPKPQSCLFPTNHTVCLSRSAALWSCVGWAAVCVCLTYYQVWSAQKNKSDSSEMRLPAATAANPQLHFHHQHLSSHLHFLTLAFQALGYLPTSQSFQISGSVSPLLWISWTKALRVSRELGLMNGRFFPCSNASFVLRHRLLQQSHILISNCMP